MKEENEKNISSSEPQNNEIEVSVSQWSFVIYYIQYQRIHSIINAIGNPSKSHYAGPALRNERGNEFGYGKLSILVWLRYLNANGKLERYNGCLSTKRNRLKQGGNVQIPTLKLARNDRERYLEKFVCYLGGI